MGAWAAVGGFVKLLGGTTGGLIGNIGDRLKVDTTITASIGTIPSVDKKLRYIDIDVANGGIARNTSITTAWTAIYSYTGSGLLLSMLLNIEDKNSWAIRLQVDEEEIFGIGGLLTSDLVSDNAYDLDDAGSPLSTSEGNIGLSLEEHDRFVWTAAASFPVRFMTSIKVFLKRTTTAKKFQAGLIIHTKET